MEGETGEGREKKEEEKEMGGKGVRNRGEGEWGNVEVWSEGEMGGRGREAASEKVNRGDRDACEAEAKC